MPVSDWAGECCFAAVRAQWLEQLHVKGSSWGQQLGKSEQEKGEIRRRFREQCGAKETGRALIVRRLQWLSLLSSGHCSAVSCMSEAECIINFQLVLVLAL